MFPELGSLIDRAEALLSKGVVLVGIFPVFLFLLISLICGYDACSWIRYWVDTFLGLEPGAQTVWAVAFLAFTSMLGFVYWTLNPTLRLLLEGHLFPRGVRLRMTSGFHAEFDELAGKVKDLKVVLFRFRRANLQAETRPETWKAKLLAARKRGVAAGGLVEPTAALQDASSELHDTMGRHDAIPFEKLDRLFRLLKSELAVNSAESVPSLDALQRSFEELADYAMAVATEEYLAVLTKLRSAFPRERATLRPTRFANILAMASDYAVGRYSIDPELFWLHFQKLAAADKDLGPLLEAAKSRLDFSVAMTVMFGAATAVWTPALIVFGSHLALVAAVGGLGLALTGAYHRGAGLNAVLYVEVLRAVVDLLRFDLLKALHIPLPASSDAERQKWRDLTLHEQLDGDTTLTYAVDPP